MGRGKGGIGSGLLDRFWAKVDQSGGDNACWPWLATCTRDGYGQFKLGWKNLRAHRFAYEVSLTEPIPEGFQLDHLCRNKLCVNPAHLEPVTNRENFLRSMHPRAVVYRSGVCIRGHVRSPENVLRNGACRACNIERCRDRYASRRAA